MRPGERPTLTKEEARLTKCKLQKRRRQRKIKKLRKNVVESYIFDENFP